MKKQSRPKGMKTLLVRTPEEWADWLEANHGSETEVWLVFHRRDTGLDSIDYHDALDEALCYGWVDSLVKRLDEMRYARKFTPRRADSRWSDVNRKRYAALKASGRLKPAGVERAPTERGYGRRPPRLPMPAELPSYIEAAFEEHPAALRHFEGLAPSQRRLYVSWIDSAKRDETKRRRLDEALRLLSAGKPLGLK